MPRSRVGAPTTKPNRNLVLLTLVLLDLLTVCTHAKAGFAVLTVPQGVSLTSNAPARQLTVSWSGGAATSFDIIILRTEFNETVFYETISVTANPGSGLRQWNWTSVEPLECTSLSVRIRSRDGQATSQWSKAAILPGKDLPTNEAFAIYPQELILPVGTNITYCCIVPEGKTFREIMYGANNVSATRLSRRTYATTLVNLEPSVPPGANVVCRLKQPIEEATQLAGTVMFVGYAPLLSDFTCETQDLTTAVCRWNERRHTNLYGKRQTRYFVNNRSCAGINPLSKWKEWQAGEWEGNWTLLAVNPLGQYNLTDSAELSHRVCPVAPVGLSAVAHAFNATVLWQWKYDGYSSLALVCEVELTTQDNDKVKSNFSGVGLRSVALSGLHADEMYKIQVRCGAQQNFWKWGSWSKLFTFRTKRYVPDAPDVWMRMNKDYTGQVFWKPLTRRQSHGQITGYEVTFWNPEENPQHTEILSPDTHTVSVNLTQMASFSNDHAVIASVVAKNIEWESQPASVVRRLREEEPLAVSRVVYTDHGFPLFWPSNVSTADCSYVVEWHNDSCTYNCPVEWVKVAAGSTNVSIESDHFWPGVRYNFTLYGCPSDSSELLHRWQGYAQELVPSSSVPLSSRQEGSNVVLTWGEIPLRDRKGFILGYNVYINNGSQLTLLANLPDQAARNYKVKGLSDDSYKFTVKAYTSAGEDTGTTVSIELEPYSDGLIFEILASLSIVTLLLIIVTFFCYKKRQWVKEALYPDIPEPKLPNDWSRTQRPLDVKPSPHSMVHVVGKQEWDSSKEALVVIPEEDEDDEGQGMGDEPLDTDEPTSLRYYNQVIDERPIRPRFPDSSDSSASSLDSANTDVTYTGIQTSGSSLVFQLDPQGYSEAQQPHPDQPVSCGDGGGGYRPQMQPKDASDDTGLASPEPFLEPQASSAGGYKPQSSWQLDSPAEDGERCSLAPSLGSPTSVASTQFLLPDGDQSEEEKRQQPSSAATWFTNLLSSSKP
ncbi:LIF receptor subunit alpha a [Mugil cephalus]|uniref:LIF receptor subunit alpha a n=1 Tax=Mugil cephalus TaxID=48193 RepID=UPI001FB65B16|nr:LIF receptor subunit alpha a [Mugil cephalus]XP_047447526.1 LIF receptor subunit alpha a [Mugil cephalus]